uniref:Lipocalin/cytosolic fatty-acid binding domain-containing protein n=1 Tax=Florenciella parvula TaxID=236787 RepID=A0A7S2BYE6_9STRA|mmetsp:Transcript_22033/g.45852  ORF Transcript_22033/g.45852 Transcript_22033/m.45852 type:complete len:413 (+) Transcript_22033:154-1392(+)|eukprot:CAMPEP_0182532840 /NCGR_PEP_ID=MMETSP1323-20130603/12452_1 /TAXON_ID=236787 /ORGANISM="Florenciella parvula, Strain RCC1693" /LENGTH=412 /DNA_ID=CAMNT_0024742641 /DNA_START=119 /DNA_END=1357 /DNA_ORIENTATION=+
MPRLTPLVVGSAFALSTSAVEVPLVTYDGADGTGALTDWFALVDPVMGGQSTGTWSLTADESYGTLDGEVKDVPSLSAPGFVTAGALGSFPDASSTIDGGVVLSIRSSTADYTGFRFSFAAGAMSPSYSCAGGGALPGSRGCFKADFTIPESDDFAEVYIPFSSFTDKWDSATGDATTTCAEDPDVCPTADLLKKIQYIEVWAEGVDGVINVDVAGVSARVDATAEDLAEHEKSVAGSDVAPVTELDAAAYVGRWYQTYASRTVKDTFQLGGNCVTADYGVTSNETVISVTNTVRLISGLGKGIVINGYAVQSPDTEGDLQVVLGPSADPEDPNAFTESNYWIIGLGPINADGLYDWATVSDEGLKSLYVLVRDVATFKAQYEDEVLTTLAEQGFTTFLNKPIETNQDGCSY